MNNPHLPRPVLARIGQAFRELGAGALEHADLPVIDAPEERTFCQEARKHLAAIEAKTAAPRAPRRQPEDPA